MAKYDTYVAKIHEEGDADEMYNLELTVLFEEGDDVESVMQQATDYVTEEGRRAKAKNFQENL